MEDRVIISRGEDDLWRWRRVAPDGHLVADGAEGHESVDDAQTTAVRVNAKPYILELRAAGLPTVDIEALAAEAEAGYQPEHLREAT